MRVIISNMTRIDLGRRTEIKRDEYMAHSRGGCRDKHDRFVYDLVVEHDCMIVCGSTSGWPAPTTDSRAPNFESEIGDPNLPDRLDKFRGEYLNEPPF
jgi:hypothetical protein